MPATRWDEWVLFAKAEKKRRESAAREKLISELEGRRYSNERAETSGSHSRRPSPARSYVVPRDLSTTRPTIASSSSHYDARATPCRIDSSIDVPSNQLQVRMDLLIIYLEYCVNCSVQWSDLQNSASPSAIIGI